MYASATSVALRVPVSSTVMLNFLVEPGVLEFSITSEMSGSNSLLIFLVWYFFVVTVLVWDTDTLDKFG